MCTLSRALQWTGMGRARPAPAAGTSARPPGWPAAWGGCRPAPAAACPPAAPAPRAAARTAAGGWRRSEVVGLSGSAGADPARRRFFSHLWDGPCSHPPPLSMKPGMWSNLRVHNTEGKHKTVIMVRHECSRPSSQSNIFTLEQHWLRALGCMRGEQRCEKCWQRGKGRHLSLKQNPKNPAPGC